MEKLSSQKPLKFYYDKIVVLLQL